MYDKTIVLTCYYFPPETNVGVRRVLFWANYFESIGYNVVVVTTKKVGSSTIFNVVNKNITLIEYSLFSANIIQFSNCYETVPEVYRTNPSSRLRDLMIKIKRKFVNPVLGQLFDFRLINIFSFMLNVRLGRYKSIIENLSKQDCVVISTAPPWPVHVLGKFLSKRLNCKHFIDYRDPFSNNHIFSSFFANTEVKIDRALCKSAAGVFSVSPSWVNYYKSFNKNVYLLRNGFDKTMFDFNQNTVSLEANKKNMLVLNYFGSIEHPSRVPHELLDLLRKTDLNIRADFYGSCSLIEELLNEDPRLRSRVHLKGILSYQETIDTMKSSDINLVCESTGQSTWSHNGLIPTKVYEYIASLRPIVAIINEDSDMVEVLKNSGLLVNDTFLNTDLELLFSKLIKDGIVLNPNTSYIQSLSRQNVSDSLLEIIM